MKLNVYLDFMGNTEAAFTFYKSVFGGEFTMFQRFKETPASGDVAPEEQDMIMHVALPVGGMTLMGTDMLASKGHKLQLGNNISLSLDIEDRAEAERIFKLLAEGGKVDMPLADMFWGAYWGAVIDQFGIRWMVNCPTKK